MSKNKIIDMCTCRQCNKEYSKKEVQRVLGKTALPVQLGFCSAQCYTKHFSNS